jgi:hypothetical protein
VRAMAADFERLLERVALKPNTQVTELLRLIDAAHHVDHPHLSHARA